MFLNSFGSVQTRSIIFRWGKPQCVNPKFIIFHTYLLFSSLKKVVKLNMKLVLDSSSACVCYVCVRALTNRLDSMWNWNSMSWT